METHHDIIKGMDEDPIARLRACDAQLSCVQHGLGIKATNLLPANPALHPIHFDGMRKYQPELSRLDSVKLKFVALNLDIERSPSKLLPNLIKRITLEISTLDTKHLMSFCDAGTLFIDQIEKGFAGSSELCTAVHEQLYEAATGELRRQFRKEIQQACSNMILSYKTRDNGSQYLHSAYGDVVIVTYDRAKLIDNLKYLKIPMLPRQVIGIVDVKDLACANRLRHQLAANRSGLPADRDSEQEFCVDEIPFLINTQYIPTFSDLAQSHEVQAVSCTQAYLQLMVNIAVKDALLSRNPLSVLENTTFGKWYFPKILLEREWSFEPDNPTLTGSVLKAFLTYREAGMAFQRKLIAAAERYCQIDKFTRKEVRYKYRRVLGKDALPQTIIAPPESYIALAYFVRRKSPQSINEPMLTELIKTIGGRQYVDTWHRSRSRNGTIEPQIQSHMDFTEFLLKTDEMLRPLVITRDGTADERLDRIHDSMRTHGCFPPPPKSSSTRRL